MKAILVNTIDILPVIQPEGRYLSDLSLRMCIVCA